MMIDNRWCFLLVFMVGICSSETSDTALGKKNGMQCTKKNIETVLCNQDNRIPGFRRIAALTDRLPCRFDTATVVSILFQILNEEKLGYHYSNDQERMFQNAFNVLNYEKQWNDQLVSIVKRKTAYFKQKSPRRYYWWVALLVSKSEDWFQYAIEVYHSGDTLNSSDRSRVYDALMERFGKNASTPEKIKVESLLYAVLQQERTSFREIDKCLAGFSSIYAGSSQRIERIHKIEQVYLEGKKMYNLPYTAVFEYINGVKQHFSTIEKLTDYTPPLVIE